MFIRKSTLDMLLMDVSDLENSVFRIKCNSVALVTCAKCGCAVMKKDAVKGEGKVLHGWHKNTIHYDYFCKQHAPKNKKGKK